jgi:hypothetical protein
MVKEIINFPYELSLSCFEEFSDISQSLSTWGLGFTSSPVFISEKFIALVEFEPANHADNGKHASHYTTEATFYDWKPADSFSGVAAQYGYLSRRERCR